jgi:hypothetical protein
VVSYSLQAADESLPNNLHVRRSQHFYMPAIDFTDFDTALGATAPSHLGVVNIVIGLSWPLK